MIDLETDTGTPETIPIIFAPSLAPRPLHHIMPMVMLMVLNMHHLQPDIMMVSLSVQDIMSAVCMIMREAEAMTGKNYKSSLIICYK